MSKDQSQYTFEQSGELNGTFFKSLKSYTKAVYCSDLLDEETLHRVTLMGISIMGLYQQVGQWSGVVKVTTPRPEAVEELNGYMEVFLETLPDVFATFINLLLDNIASYTSEDFEALLYEYAVHYKIKNTPDNRTLLLLLFMAGELEGNFTKFSDVNIGKSVEGLAELDYFYIYCEGKYNKDNGFDPSQVAHDYLVGTVGTNEIDPTMVESLQHTPQGRIQLNEMRASQRQETRGVIGLERYEEGEEPAVCAANRIQIFQVFVLYASSFLICRPIIERLITQLENTSN